MKGVHTGSQTAAILGRIPIEDVARSRAHIWLEHKFDIAPYDGPCFANWCDNVFASGATQADAAAIIEDLDIHLRHQWDLRLSGDAKSMILPRHSTGISAELVNKGWQQTACFSALGRHYADNGSTELAWQILKPRLWRAFWANSGRKNLRCSAKLKLSLMKRTIDPIIRFHVNGWPFCKTRAKHNNAAQYNIGHHNTTHRNNARQGKLFS